MALTSQWWFVYPTANVTPVVIDNSTDDGIMTWLGLDNNSIYFIYTGKL
jgi:hypothetical protein